MNNTANSYNSQFNADPPSVSDIVSNAEYKGNSFDFGRVDFGQDITDTEYLSDDYDWYNAVDTHEDRAQGQSWGSKAGHGIARAAHGFLNNVLQTPGYLVGGVAAGLNEAFGDGEGSMDMFVNNAWINALEKEKEWFNNEAMPVYVKNAVKNGNIWDAITSVDFWATEGADGVGFMAAAMVPGVGVKALGNLGRAVRTASKLRRVAKGGEEAIKAATAVDRLAKVDGTATNLAKKLNFKDAADMFDVANATVINTIYESGVEARGVGEGYDRILAEKKHQLENGDITQEQFDTFNIGKAKAMRNAFTANMGLLLLPNAIMNKAFLGAAVKESNALGKFAVKNAAGKFVANEAERGFKAGAKKWAKNLGQNFLMEGFVEEGGQMAIEKKFTGESEKSWGETYLDIIKSTEGQKAILLGGVLGTGMYTIGQYRPKSQKDSEGNRIITTNRKEEVKHQDKIIEAMNESLPILDNMGTGLFKTEMKDDKEVIAFDEETNEPIYDPEKVAQLGANVEWIQTLHGELQKYRAAQATGSKSAGLMADDIQQTLLNSALSPFIRAGEDGIALLKNHLEHSTGMKDIVDKTNMGRPIKLSKDEVIKKIVTEAEAQVKDIEFYDRYNEFRNELLKNEDEATYELFATQKRNSFINNKSRLRVIADSLEKENQALSTLQDEHEKRYKSLKEGWREDKTKGSKAVKNQRELINELKGLNDSIEEQLKADTTFSNVKSQFEKFNKEVREERGEMEKSPEYTELVKDINTAKTRSELNDIKDTETYKNASENTKKNLNDVIDQKKLEIANRAKNTATKATKKAVEKSESTENETEAHNEAFNNIYNNKNSEDFATGMMDNLIGISDEMKASKSIQLFKLLREGQKELTLLDVLSKEEVNIREIEFKQELPIAEEFDTEGDVAPGNVTEGTIEGNKDEMDELEEKANESVTSVKVMSTFDPIIIAKTLEGQDPNTDVSDREKLNDLFEDKNKNNQLLDFERNPIKKEGTPVSFEIEFDSNITGDKVGSVKLALKQYKDYKNGEKLNKEQFEHMVDFLPIKMTLDNNENVFSYLETLPDIKKWKQESVDIFKTHTYPLKERIIKGDDLNYEVTGQAGGKLNVEALPTKGGIAENNVLELSQVNGDLSKVELTLLNDQGELHTPSNKKIDHSMQLEPKWASAIFMKVHKANGKEFHLKLNRARTSEKQAEFIYLMYRERLLNNLGHNTLLDKTSPELQAFIKEHLKSELKVLKDVTKKGFKDLTLGELENLLIYNGSKSTKSKVKMVGGDAMYFGSKQITSEDLDNEDMKEEFIDWVSKNKNRNVKFKKNDKDLNPNLNMSNLSYKKYVLESKILNTNTRVKAPMFVGFTNMYISEVPKKDTKKPEKIAHSKKESVSLSGKKPRVLKGRNSGNKNREMKEPVISIKKLKEDGKKCK